MHDVNDPFPQRELLHPFQRVQVKRRILPDAEKEIGYQIIAEYVLITS